MFYRKHVLLGDQHARHQRSLALMSQLLDHVPSNKGEYILSSGKYTFIYFNAFIRHSREIFGARQVLFIVFLSSWENGIKAKLGNSINPWKLTCLRA